jgi:hypothetical protein
MDMSIKDDKIHIPFLERFKEPMLNGTKFLTSRTKQYGEIGDRFDAFGATFEIIWIGKLPLGQIEKFWKEEGMQSLDDFVNTWKGIHPKRKYDLNERFWTHKFRKI